MNRQVNKKRYKDRNKRIINGVKDFGCALCGYAKTSAAIDFHHVVDDKRFEISSHRGSFSEQSLREEINKCIRVCANCHREIHAGLISEKKVMKAYRKQQHLGIGQMNLFENNVSLAVVNE